MPRPKAKGKPKWKVRHRDWAKDHQAQHQSLQNDTEPHHMIHSVEDQSLCCIAAGLNEKGYGCIGPKVPRSRSHHSNQKGTAGLHMENVWTVNLHGNFRNDIPIDDAHICCGDLRGSVTWILSGFGSCRREVWWNWSGGYIPNAWQNAVHPSSQHVSFSI